MPIKPLLLTGAAGAVVATLAVAGCGQSTDGGTTAGSSESATASVSPSVTPSATPSDPASASPTASAAPAGWKPCSALWRAGAALPKPYPGCSDRGQAVAAHTIGCSSGQSIVIYGDHYYAVAGGTIARSARVLANSREYVKAIATCRG